MAQFQGKAHAVTQVSTGQVTGQQTAGASLETLPAGAQLRGQIASGAPEGMMRLAVGSARLDVKADVPLPAGTPVLIEVEQAAPEMRLKVSADASALQGRTVPAAGSPPAAGPALSESVLQGQQLKAASLAQVTAGSPSSAGSGGAAGVTSRPAQASVDLSTFVFLKTEASVPKTGNAPSTAAGVSRSGGAAGGQAAGGMASPTASQEAGGTVARSTAGAGSQPGLQPSSQAGGPGGTPQNIPPAPSQAASMAGGGGISPSSQAASQAGVQAGNLSAAPTPQALASGAGQTTASSMAGAPAPVPVSAASSAAGAVAAPSAGVPSLAGTSSPLAGMSGLGATVSGVSAPGAFGAGAVNLGGGAGLGTAGTPADFAGSAEQASPLTATSTGRAAVPPPPEGVLPSPAGSASTLASGSAMTPAGNPGAVSGGPQISTGAGAQVMPGAASPSSGVQAGGQPAATPSAASGPSVAKPVLASASGASDGPAAAMANLPPLSGPEAEAELQALARGAGPLTARGDAALALDPQALKPVLTEPAQARTVLASLMGTVSKLDVTSLPPAGQKLVEALKGLQADAESLSDPARLRAAVEAVLGLAAGAGGAVAAGLSRKANVPQKADGLTSLLVRLAGLADEVLLSQPSRSDGQKAGQTAAKPQVMQNLDPDAALALAQKTGGEVGERVRLHSASRMAAEYLIRDMAQAASRGSTHEAPAGQSRAVSGAGAAAQQSGGTGSSSPAARPVDISLDLPVLIDGQSRVMSLRISRDPQQAETVNDAKGPEWRVRFSMDLPDGGPVEAAAGLRGTSSYVTLRAAEDETLAGFLSRRETLAALFADEGLELEDLRILKAKPETSAAVPQAPLDRSS